MTGRVRPAPDRTPAGDAGASYELLSHAADVRAIVRGHDRLEVYQAAVDLVRYLLVGHSPVDAATRRVFAADAGDHTWGGAPVSGSVAEGERFHRFVRELLYLYDVERFVPRTVVAVEPTTVLGETFDPARHEVAHQVKALTRHRYTFSRSPRGFRVEMVFDL